MAVQRHGVGHDLNALLQRVQIHAPLKRGAERAQLRRLNLAMSTLKCRGYAVLKPKCLNAPEMVSLLRNDMLLKTE